LLVVITMHQVEWSGREHLRLMPKASANNLKALHFECSVCGTHV
jgi:hypothetical protein